MMVTPAELPIIETRYQNIGATYDLAPLLANGMLAYDEGSVMATVETNHVFWDCRLVHTSETDPNSPRFFDGIPEELMPPVSATRPGMLGSQIVQIQWNARWRFMQVFLRRLDAGSLFFEARTLRRPA